MKSRKSGVVFTLSLQQLFHGLDLKDQSFSMLVIALQPPMRYEVGSAKAQVHWCERKTRLDPFIMISKAVFVQLVTFVLVTIGQTVGAQVITSFSPKAGAPGDQIQLVGSGFQSGGALRVRFWNG